MEPCLSPRALSWWICNTTRPLVHSFTFDSTTWSSLFASSEAFQRHAGLYRAPVAVKGVVGEESLAE
eukprot:7018435-Prymnesium_polylepis.1